jgi:microcystin-dependent protein
MAEPTTPNIGLISPNTGDLVGSWGTTALNANWLALDGVRGGVTTISLSSATTITLTAPSGSITPSAGPTQQQNFMLRFTGTQTGNAVLQFNVPGPYVIDNRCTGTTAYLQLVPAVGTGNYVGVPQGKKTWVCFDGTDVDFLNPQDPGTAYDLHGALALPLWMQACKVAPYLPKDGTVYNISTYPALAAVLGSTFGGNGVTTFGVPDERSRMRLAWDNSGTANRVTSAGSGISGITMGAAGGDQLLQAHNHTLTDGGHTHVTVADDNTGIASGVNGGNAGGFSLWNTASPAHNITSSNSTSNISIATTGSGAAQNMPPTIVSFLASIKT